jgi:hypothetical protein
MKKFMILTLSIITLSVSSLAVGFAWGHATKSNMYGGYPEFNGYLPHESGKHQVKEYIQKAKDYDEACENDMKMISEARERAFNKTNDVINEYKDR